MLLIYLRKDLLSEKNSPDGPLYLRPSSYHLDSRAPQFHSLQASEEHSSPSIILHITMHSVTATLSLSLSHTRAHTLAQTTVSLYVACSRSLSLSLPLSISFSVSLPLHLSHSLSFSVRRLSLFPSLLTGWRRWGVAIWLAEREARPSCLKIGPVLVKHMHRLTKQLTAKASRTARPMEAIVVEMKMWRCFVWAACPVLAASNAGRRTGCSPDGEGGAKTWYLLDAFSHYNRADACLLHSAVLAHLDPADAADASGYAPPPGSGSRVLGPECRRCWVISPW